MGMHDTIRDQSPLLADRRFARALGLAAIALTVPSAVGWLFGIPWLVQPFETFAPARLGGTVIIGTGAGGLLALVAGRKALARRLAVLCALVALAAMLAAWWNVPLPFDALVRARIGDRFAHRDIPTSTALLFCLYGTTLYMLASAALSDRRHAVTGTLSALLVASSGALLLAQLAGLLGAAGIANAPVQSLLAAQLLGTALLQRIMAEDIRNKAPPSWAPALAGTSTMLLVLVLWQALVARERSQERAQAALAGAELDRAVQRQFLAVDRAVGRSALFLAGAGRVDAAAWTTTLPRLIDEISGLTSMAWLDSAGTVLRVIPDRPLPPSVQRQLVDILVRWDTTGRMPAPPPVTVAAGPSPAPAATMRRILSLSNTPWGVAVIYPIASLKPVESRAATYLVGFVDEAELTGEFARDERDGFALAVTRGDSTISGRVLRETLRYTAPLYLGARQLTVSVSPATAPLRSSLPELVLLLGFGVAALLSITMWQQRAIWAQASAAGMQRLQQAIERSTDGVWELDLVRGTMHRSPALLQYLGVDSSTLDGGFAAWSALIHPDDRAAYGQALDTHVRGEVEAFSSEYRLRAGDGTWHTLVDRGRVVERTVDGRAARVLGISADVTESTIMNAAREESDRRFRAMFDTANQLQLLLDGDGAILKANRAAAALARTTVDALTGVRFSLAPWWAEHALIGMRVQDRFVKARAGDTNHFEVEVVGAGDRPATIDFSLTPVRDHEQHVVQVLVEGRDITVRKKAEESLREIGALTTMGRLAARVVHEINNPLAGIQNAFLLISGAIPTDHPHYRFVGAIEREIGRIAAVTRQLYETYRPEQFMITQSSVILAVTDAISFLEQVNRGRQVSIKADLSSAPTLVPIPDALLRQTMYNLIQNAVDASPEHGTVTVTAVVEEHACVIRVADEGPGVPVALRERIFEPFFSTKDRTVKTGGMGIGLSLVRQSVQAVGGTIAVHERQQGGAEFEVRLPMTPLDTGVLR